VLVFAAVIFSQNVIKSVMKWCFGWWCLLFSLDKCMLHGIDHQLSETVGQEV
jgi:hypothetical protein